ncbi:MAG: hypothetical protein JW729_07660 [Bacteroidales bacterium]|nr:hypothetical protein [Bacteroidales bacterium]
MLLTKAHMEWWVQSLTRLTHRFIISEVPTETESSRIVVCIQNHCSVYP